jgi:hypothetical protein
MKTVFCDLCGQQLTEAEVEGMVHLPSLAGKVVMFPQIRRLGGGPIDACWHCMAEQLLAVAPPRQPAEPSGQAEGHGR